ncbi:MAG: hypothetical protein WC768_01950 [Patescibacteria group bacterium]|jgi:hypothetical protein
MLQRCEIERWVDGVNRASERAVLVKRWPGRWGWVNQERLVRDVLGFSLGRYACVVSFADGLAAAGYQVFIRERWSKNECIYPYVWLGHGIVLPYYLLGLAWAKDQWEVVAQQLRTFIVLNRRLEVLETTGRYYLQNPELARAAKKIELLVKVGDLRQQ